MSKSLSLELPWNEETFLQGAKLAYEVDMRYGWRRYVGWFFVALAQFGVVGAVLYGKNGLLFVATFLILYWYFLRWPLRKRMLKRFFSHRQKSDRLQIILDDEGIHVEERLVPWIGIRRLVVAEAGYLLEMEESFLFFPRAIFSDAKKRNDFVAVLREHVPNYLKFS